MALLLKRLYQGYLYVAESVDPRTDYMYLVGSPAQAILATIAYVYVVKSLGPRLMESRKPFNIRSLIIVYNTLQIIFNFYISVRAFYYLQYVEFKCGPIDYSFEPIPMAILHTGYLYLFMKVFDWIDTIFFVLKKSYRQITFLHVYHHANIFLGSWGAMTFFGGGKNLWVVAVNSVVHFLMFSYYLLSAIDSKWKQNHTIKKLITQIQLAQFGFFIIIYGMSLLQAECTFPRFIGYAFLPQNFFMLSLFGEFYWKTYIKKKQKL